MTVVQDDVLRATAQMSIGVDDLQNVLHYQLTSAPSVSDAQALLDIGVVLDDLYDFIDAKMKATVLFDDIRVQNITQSVLLGSTAWPTLVAGLAAGELLPQPVAALITYPTAVPKTRGMTYFGGFTEGDNGNNAELSSALLAALLNLAAEALADKVVGANTYRYVLINRALGTVIPLVSSLVPIVWRTQRRRRQGVGS